MKRPLVICSICFAVGVFWVMHGGEVPASLPAVLALSAAGTALGIRFRKIRPVCAALLALLWGSWYAGWYSLTVSGPISKLDGEVHAVSAQVLEYADVYEDNQRVRVRIPKEQLEVSRDVTTLIYLPLTERRLEPGDQIDVTAEFYLPTYSQGFDRELHYRSGGVFVLCSAKDFKAERNAPSVYDLEVMPQAAASVWDIPKKTAHRIREQITSRFSERQGAFLTALLLGDRSQLTTIDSNHLKKAGLSHVIAVSGLHVGFLIALLMLLFGRRLGSVLSVPMLVFFFLMVGWSPSVARAGIMYLFLIASFWFRQESSSLNSISAALLVILLYLPTSVDSVSLQLSFSATLGLVLFSGRMNRALSASGGIRFSWLRRIWNWIAASVSCTLCTQIFAMPILMHYFGYLSVLSVLSNLAVLWVVSAVFALGCGFAVTCLVIPAVSGLFAAGIAPLIDFIWYVTDRVAELPFGLLYANRTLGIAAAAVLYLTIVLLLLHVMPRLTLPIGAIVIAVLCRMDWQQSLTETRISFLSVGYGQAALVSCAEECVLIDCGASGHYNAAQSVQEYMDWNGIEDIDSFILTSVDKTHARNAAELMKDADIGELILPAVNRENDTLKQILQTAEQETLPVEYFGEDDSRSVGASELGISVLGGIERKLLVQIDAGGETLLSVHSATQNMLLEYLKTHTLHADQLAASAQITEDLDEMEQILSKISPKQIVLSTGWETATKFAGIPVYNLYEHGEWSCTVSEESR